MPQMTTTIDVQRREQLRNIITDVLELEPGELTDTSSFVDDHEADSLLAIEILARIERDLGVNVPQEALAEMVNLATVYTIVARNADWKVSDA
jgi:acyl carrier protein